MKPFSCLRLVNRTAILIATLLMTWSTAQADDWPTWRYDAARSATTPQKLSDQLHPQWTLKLPLPAPAWPEDRRLMFDIAYQPVVVGKSMFVASMRNDSVTAYHTDTAKTLWRFVAEGPVRFAPIVHQGKVYFGCDDGSFYCLSATTGKQVWRLADLPSARRVIGNDRLISVWPVRGGPVLHNNRLYYTTGIWPFESAFLNQIDLGGAKPKLVATVLENESPQGYLSMSGEQLVIPCGRKQPLVVHASSMRRGRTRAGSKGWDDWHTVSSDKLIFHGLVAQDPTKAATLGTSLIRPVVSGQTIYGGTSKRDSVQAISLIAKTKESKDRKGNIRKSQYLPNLWQVNRTDIHNALAKMVTGYDRKSATKPIRIMVRAGDKLFGYLGHNLFALQLNDNPQTPPKVVWGHQIHNAPAAMLAADDKLFVATHDGAILAFGAQAKANPPTIDVLPAAPKPAQGPWQVAAQQMLKLSGPDGFGIVLGAGTGQLVNALQAESKLRLIVLEKDPAKANALRRKIGDAQYGHRVVVHVGDLRTLAIAPYLANLITSEQPADIDAAMASAIFRTLRPYGGSACFKLTGTQKGIFAKHAQNLASSGATLTTQDGLTALRRVGALEGSASWTHEYADAGNTLMSRDKLVKAPLGLLWYGGPSSHGSLYYDRHDWPPSLLVRDGRLIFQGPDTLVAVDVYTGRIFWKNKLPKGKSPGRRGNFDAVGYHLIAEKDVLYLTYPDRCMRIDPVTGKTLSTFKLPDAKDTWGRITTHGEKLIVPVFQTKEIEGKGKANVPTKLLAMDRHTGKILWQKEANNTFLFSAVGKDRLFCFDGHLEDFYKDWGRKGKIPKAIGAKTLLSIDLNTGETKWKNKTEKAITWVSYSKEHDVMIASNRNGIEAIRGLDGYQLWEKKALGKGFKGHPESLWDKVILWKDRVIDQRGPGLAYDITTGKNKPATHPITGKPVNWEFTKHGHHCNYAIASENLMTFRAASAGYFDLKMGGTSRLEGFRPGCRNSLIPADGVLNAPNFGYGCRCSYSIFTSLALVHVPDNDRWTYTAYKASKDAVKRLGVNFGAPGDRPAENGTVWFDWPSRGGTSPNLPIKTAPSKPASLFAKHSSEVSGEGKRWVAASGVEGLESVTLQVDPAAKKPKPYTVKLIFAEPMATQAGQRVFDVSINGKVVMKNLDVFKEAGGKMKILARSFPNISAAQNLTVSLKAQTGKPVISGIEVVAE